MLETKDYEERKYEEYLKAERARREAELRPSKPHGPLVTCTEVDGEKIVAYRREE